MRSSKDILDQVVSLIPSKIFPFSTGNFFVVEKFEFSEDHIGGLWLVVGDVSSVSARRLTVT